MESAEQLQEVVDGLMHCEEFCFDTETTGLDLFRDRIVGLSLAVRPFEAWYVPFTPAVEERYAEIIRPPSRTNGWRRSARTSSSTSWSCAGWA